MCLRNGQGGFAAVRGQTPGKPARSTLPTFDNELIFLLGREGNILVSFLRPEGIGTGFNLTSSVGDGAYSLLDSAISEA